MHAGDGGNADQSLKQQPTETVTNFHRGDRIVWNSGGVSLRAIVTGGAGFLGSHLCDRLIQNGWEVLAIDNFVTGTEANIAHLAGNPRFQFLRHDVSRFIEVPGPVDYVLHFASPASPVDYLKLPIQTLKVGAL